MHLISVQISVIAGAIIDGAVVASVFDKVAVYMDFALFIEAHVYIADVFAVPVAIAAIDITDVTPIATISVALDDFTL